MTAQPEPNQVPETEYQHDGGPMPEWLEGQTVSVKVPANGGTWMWPAKANSHWNWPVIIAFRLSPQKDGEGGLGETAPLQGSVPARPSADVPSQQARVLRDMSGEESVNWFAKTGMTPTELFEALSHPGLRDGIMAAIRLHVSGKVVAHPGYPTRPGLGVDGADRAADAILGLIQSIDPSTCGTSASASDPIPPTTQERIASELPDLTHVINWLENGCAVEHAVTELRIHQARLRFLDHREER